MSLNWIDSLRRLVVLCLLVLWQVQAHALVDMKNANYSKSWVDINPIVSDRETLHEEGILNLAIERTYNSRSLHDGLFGFGWCSDLETRLKFSESGVVRLIHCGGGQEKMFGPPHLVDNLRLHVGDVIARIRSQAKKSDIFSKIFTDRADQHWLSLRETLMDNIDVTSRVAKSLDMKLPDLTGLTLREMGGGYSSLFFQEEEIYLVSSKSQIKLIFDRGGRLTGMQHQDGRRIDITYDDSGRPVRVQNREGRALILTYSENGKIATIAHPLVDSAESLKVLYKYSREGDLIEVDNAWRKNYLYYYDNEHNLIQTDWPDKTSTYLHYDKDNDWVISFQDRDKCIENYIYDIKNELHYFSYVLKHCGEVLVAANTYEFWLPPRGGSKRAPQRISIFANNQSTEIDYEPIFDLPVHINRGGVITTYENSSDGRVISRNSGDMRWLFLSEPDAEGFSVLEERIHPSGIGEITRHKTDPWKDLYLMPAAETERQKKIQADSVRRAMETAGQLKTSSELLVPKLNRWREMRSQRRFESAAALAKELDAELQGTVKSEQGRLGITQLALELADELADTKYLEISLALARFVLQVSREVESADAARAALLISKQSRREAKPEQSVSALQEAIEILTSRRETKRARTMNALYLELAAAERAAGSPRRALDALRKLPSHKISEGDSTNWSMETVGEVANIYYEAGLYDQALETLLQSRALFLSLVDQSNQWSQVSPDNVLSVAEDVFRAQGRFDDALAINRVRGQYEFKGQPLNPSDHKSNVINARLLGSQALTLIYAGQYGAASQLIETALLHSTDNDSVRSSLLGNRALLLSRLGLYAEASNDNREAMRLSKSHVKKENSASFLADLGRYSEAEAVFQEVVDEATNRLPPSHPALADLRVKWAEARLQAGRPDSAIHLLDIAIDSLQTSLGFSHWRVTRALVIRAKATIELHDAGGASAWATRALLSAYAGGLPEWQSVADHVFSRMLALSGNNSLAIFFGKRAVNALQHVRSQLIGLDTQSQILFMKARLDVFKNASALLIDAGRIGEAQQVLAMYKFYELQQFTQRRDLEDPRNIRTSVNSVESRWQATINQRAARLGEVSAELSKLEALRGLGSLSASEMRRREQLLDIVDDQQLIFSRTLDAIRSEIESSTRDQARGMLTSAELTATSLRSLVDKLSKQSSSRVVALQYIVLDEKIYILVTTPQLQFSKEVALNGQRLGALVESFRSALTDTRIDPRPEGRKLYSLLLEPIATELKDYGASTLMISLTGSLRYVPFAALHDGSRYLVEQFRVALMSESALRLGMQPPQATWNVVGLGVSAKVDPDFQALPAVLDEIAAVVKHEQGVSFGTLPGVAWLNNEFTADRLQSVISDAPAVIHVASHFKLSPDSDTRSFLLLGDGTRLTLREMMGSRYRFGMSDLLTLSACETGVGGGHDLAGREVEGLAALSLRQGAPAVLATLWSVGDASTAYFMQRFYALRQVGNSVSKGEALQRAQIEMLRGAVESHAGTAPASPNLSSRYSHPYFWAPFILLGNWL